MTYLQVIPILSTGLCTISAIWALFMAIKARDFARMAAKWCEERAERKQMAELSAELTSLTDSYDSLLAMHKRLRSRIGMREKRERDAASNGADGDAVPSDAAAKAAYKQRLRHDLKAKGLL